MPIYEPGLEALVAENVRQGRLSFRTRLHEAVAEADAVFIAVGTPSRRGDRLADLNFVFSAAREIAAALTGYTVVVTKSTVPVGTGDEVGRIIRAARAEAEFAVVSNPEFLREGAAIADFKRPDRIVVGCEDARGDAVMREAFRPPYLNQAPILVTGRHIASSTRIDGAPWAELAHPANLLKGEPNVCVVVRNMPHTKESMRSARWQTFNRGPP